MVDKLQNDKSKALERRKDEIDFDFSNFKDACLAGMKQNKFDNKELIKLLKSLRKDLVR